MSKTWEERQRPVEEATAQELADYLYDWHHGMCHSFNGAPFPSDFPRAVDVSSYTHKGMHLCFSQYVTYCKSLGINIGADDGEDN